jgi:hypothetical protein
MIRREVVVPGNANADLCEGVTGEILQFSAGHVKLVRNKMNISKLFLSSPVHL